MTAPHGQPESGGQVAIKRIVDTLCWGLVGAVNDDESALCGSEKPLSLKAVASRIYVDMCEWRLRTA